MSTQKVKAKFFTHLLKFYLTILPNHFYHQFSHIFPPYMFGQVRPRGKIIFHLAKNKRKTRRSKVQEKGFLKPIFFFFLPRYFTTSFLFSTIPFHFSSSIWFMVSFFWNWIFVVLLLNKYFQEINISLKLRSFKR